MNPLLSTIKDSLLEAGKEEGCITFSTLNDMLPDHIKEPGQIEEIFDFLGQHNIAIVTEEESGERKTLAGETWDASKDLDSCLLNNPEEIVSLPDDDVSESEETTTTYLREMGRFDLLTPDDEAKYSRTIREGFYAILNSVRDDDSGVPEMERLKERIDLW